MQDLDLAQKFATGNLTLNTDELEVSFEEELRVYLTGKQVDIFLASTISTLLFKEKLFEVPTTITLHEGINNNKPFIYFTIELSASAVGKLAKMLNVFNRELCGCVVMTVLKPGGVVDSFWWVRQGKLDEHEQMQVTEFMSDYLDFKLPSTTNPEKWK